MDKSRAWKCKVVAKVQPPTEYETRLLQDRILVSFIQPDQNSDLVEQLHYQGATAFAMDNVPRHLANAKEICAISSQATIAGYRAIIEAAHGYKHFFSGRTTLNKTFPPAKVLVIGGGVAGLSAIATAKSMGAEVEAYDSREEVRGAVEACGGKFLRLSDEIRVADYDLRDRNSKEYQRAEV